MAVCGGVHLSWQHHHAVGGQQLGAALEEGVVVIDADMFEHSDRHDAMERAGDVAIILQQEFRAAGQVFLAGTGIGVKKAQGWPSSG